MVHLRKNKNAGFNDQVAEMAALVVFMVGLRFKSYYQKIRGYIFWGEFVFVCTYRHAYDDDDDDDDHEQQQN